MDFVKIVSCGVKEFSRCLRDLYRSMEYQAVLRAVPPEQQTVIKTVMRKWHHGGPADNQCLLKIY
jgi:hypothetical protein